MPAVKNTFSAAMLCLCALGLASCSATLAQKKEEAAIHFRIGAVHLNEKNYTDALKELTKAVEIYPDDPAYRNALGLTYFLGKGMNAEAKKEMQKALALDPNFSEAHANLAAIYIDEKKWDPAIAESREALKNIFYKTPEVPYFNMGWAHYNKGDYAAALESFKKSVQINPNYSTAYYYLGLIHDKMNNIKESTDAFEKASRIAPGYVDAYFGLGLGLVKLKDRPGAKKAFEKVIELSPKSDKARSARDYINLLN